MLLSFIVAALEEGEEMTPSEAAEADGIYTNLYTHGTNSIIPFQ